jgi:hypothetical protein
MVHFDGGDGRVINSQRIAFSEGGGWELAKLDLDNFAQALSEIWSAAPPDCFKLSRPTPHSGTQSRHSTPTYSSRTHGRIPQSIRSHVSFSAVQDRGAQCAYYYQTGIHAVGNSH